MKLQNSITQNKTKTWLIMGLFTVFITTVVYVFVKSLGYSLSYVWFALVFSLITSVASYFYSDKLVLATSGAQKASKEDYPVLYEIVEKLTKEDNLPMPKIYIIKDPSANAFATGRDAEHAVVAATTGILERLNKTELEGVIAHELSHVKNLDIRLMTIVSVLVGFVALLSNLYTRNLWFGQAPKERENNSLQSVFLIIGIILAILSPIIATLIQLAVSRRREFLADASGALLTKYPEGLASALEKISKNTTTLKTANNATAHLFIVNPFKGKDASWLANLFQTHPPIQERVRILRSM